MTTVSQTAKNKWHLFHVSDAITILLVNFYHEPQDVWQDLSHVISSTGLQKTGSGFTCTSTSYFYSGTIEPLPNLLQDTIDCKYYDGANIDLLTAIATSGRKQSLSTVTF